MSKPLKYTIIFFISFFLAIVFISFDKNAANLEGDASIYLTIAKNIANGDGFSHEISPPYSPTMSREPVYPLFLSIFYLFNKNILIVQLVQGLIYALTCIVVFKIVSMVLPRSKFTFLISLTIATFPTIPSYTPYLITEILFTFLLALFVLSLLKSFESNKLKWFFCSGILLGVATLCRGILMLFFIFAIVVIAIYYRRIYRKIFTLPIIRVSFVFLIGYFLIIGPWMLRNYKIFNRFALTLRGYSTMYTRTAKVNLDKNELKMYTVYCFSEYLANKLYPKYNLTSTAKGYFYQPLLSKIKEYYNRGMSPEEADSMFKKEALSLIRSHPLKFIATGIFEVVKFNSFGQVLLLNEKSTFLAVILRGIFKILGFFIFALAIIGIGRTYRDWHKWLILFSVIVYFNVMHFFLDSVGRYSVPIIPYYLFFSVLGIKGIANLVGRKKRAI